MKKKTAPAPKPAPKPAARKKKAAAEKGDILVERPGKLILRDGETVLKIFGPEYRKSAILNEAMNEARAEETGLPVPKVLEVLKIREHWCIRREYVAGKTLAEKMASSKRDLGKILEQFVSIQCAIFAKTSERMGNIVEKLDRQISQAGDLVPRETRYDLHVRLQSFPRGNSLLHGDFNPTNVIVTPKGDWRVIDWSHVRLGDPMADAARTYLLFWLSGHVAAADRYMELMCKARGVRPPAIQKWLPVVAAAEMAKDGGKNRELLLHWASVVDYE